MGRPRRLAATNYIGIRPVFLTLCTAARQRVFIDPAAIAFVESQILRTAATLDFSLLAYCFMPDHLHLLVGGRNAGVDASVLVKLAKQTTGYAFKRRTGERLWQPSFFDRTLRDDEDVIDVIRYVIANPVRAGLVSAPATYPYWGSTVYSRSTILEFFDEAARRHIC